MLKGYDPVAQAALGSLFTWGVTALGSAFVFFLKPSSQKILDSSLGFSAGVMTAASFWSLLEPAIHVAHEMYGEYGFATVLGGFLMGAAFVYLFDAVLDWETTLDFFTKCAHAPGSNGRCSVVPTETASCPATIGYDLRRRPLNAANMDTERCSTDKQTSTKQTATSWRRIVMLIFAITVHNIPEGMAVGVGFGAAGSSTGYTFEKARSLAVGIGLQNFPEGLAVSLPLAAYGYSKRSSFFYGQLSGMVEPLAALGGAYSVAVMHMLLPMALSFAAGAMIYVVFDDVIPEAQSRGNRHSAVWSVIVGFMIMMSMDTLL